MARVARTASQNRKCIQSFRNIDGNLHWQGDDNGAM